MHAVHEWLHYLERETVIAGMTLAHGVQGDTNSCGVFAINMVAHSIFDEPLLCTESTSAGRAYVFNNIGNYYLRLTDDDTPPISLQSSNPDTNLFSADSTSDLTGGLPQAGDQILTSESSSGDLAGDPTGDFTGERAGDGLSLGNLAANLTGDLASDWASNQLSSGDLAGDLTGDQASDRLSSSDKAGDPTNNQSGDPTGVRTRDPTGELAGSLTGKSISSFDDIPQKLVAATVSPRPSTHIAEIFKKGFVDNTSSSTKKRKADSDDGERYKKYLKPNPKPIRTANSSVNARKTLAAAKAGTFTINRCREIGWKEKILAIDPGATFTPDNVIDVCCSNCGKIVRTKTVYDVTRFKAYYLDRVCKKATVKHKHTLPDQSIDAWATRVKPEGSSKPPSPKKTAVPCPGLTVHDDKSVVKYLSRTMAAGGGARSVVVLAKKRYGVTFSKLRRAVKRLILDLQTAEHRWRNNHWRERVFASSCLGTISFLGNIVSVRILPCANCNALFQDRHFRRALKRDACEDSNSKFINHRFRIGPLLATKYRKTVGLRELLQAAKSDTESVLLRYASGVVDGKYPDNKLLAGLIESFTNVEEHKKKGKGMQNFQYPPEWDKFMHLLSIKSSRVYKFLSKYLPARSQRSFR